MKMYPDDWRVRLTVGVVSAACFFAALMLAPMVGFHGFWPGMLSVVVGMIVGNLLGTLLCRRLWPPPGGPPEKKQESDSHVA